jgi:serine/threonine protein kinase
MQYCSHGTLRHYIDNREHVNHIECAFLFEQMLLGLHHIHSSSLIHRDIKPDNIFFDEPLHLRIGDFGLCTQLSFYLNNHNNSDNNKQKDPKDTLQYDGLDMTHKVGSYLYAAPEQMDGNHSYTNKADMFSIGIILLELFSICRSNTTRILTICNARKNNCNISLDLFDIDVNDYNLVQTFQKNRDHSHSTSPHSIQFLHQQQKQQEKQCIDDINEDTDLGPIHQIQCQERDEITSLICNLLSHNPNERLSCEEILKSQWMKKQRLLFFNHGFYDVN